MANRAETAKVLHSAAAIRGVFATINRAISIAVYASITGRGGLDAPRNATGVAHALPNSGMAEANFCQAHATA